MSVSILAFAGSSRRGSLNQGILRTGMRAAEAAGAAVTYVDLKVLALPIMDQDLEDAEGLPPGARRLKELMRAADGFLIATPEYNSGYPPLLKNALDWASRRESAEEKPLEAFAGKVAGLIAASPGQLGGLRALFALRGLLQNLQVVVVPAMAATPRLQEESFGPDGELADPAAVRRITDVAGRLVETARKIAVGG